MIARLRWRWRYWRQHVNMEARAAEAARFKKRYGYPA